MTLRLVGRRYFATASVPAVRGLAIAEGVDGVIVGVDEAGQLWPGSQFLNTMSEGRLERQLRLSGHSFKSGAVRVLLDTHPTVPRAAVVTCPRQGWTQDATRRAAAEGARALREYGARKIQVEQLGCFQAAAEGVHLGLYQFTEYKKRKDGKEITDVLPLCDTTDTQDSAKAFRKGTLLAQAQNWARTLAERPPNALTPAAFAQTAQEVLESGSRKVQVFVRDQEWIQKAQMNMFLGVAQGSAKPPRLLEIKYEYGNPSAPHVMLVGKGITFDSGGISIKPSAHMDMMKGDMGGAAAVVGAMKAIRDLDLNVNVSALVPMCENMPSGTALRPGDIISSSGKTIEIINTDAEGRLILGDALYYASSSVKPPMCIIDVATLTGAIDVALGYYGCGMFSNNSTFFNDAAKAAEAATGEIVHPMPIGKWHTKQIESSVADIRNSTESRSGGAATAAAFLKHFVVNNVPWMHLDMAAVMHASKTDGYDVKGMTGRPTRLLVDLVQRLQQA